MAQFQILVSDGLDDEGLALLRQGGEVRFKPQISAEDLQVEIGDCDALVVRSRTRVTRAVIQAGKQLKVIGRAGVGVDNIDLSAAAGAGIIVVNSPTAATRAVAEMALAFMLALARQLPAQDASMKMGKWEKSAYLGSELNGKTLGIVGLGRIGSQLALYARAIGMHVLAYHPDQSEAEVARLGAQITGFDELLAGSDYLSIHTPLNGETRNLLGRAEFARMKPGVRLINTARGGIVDEVALCEALDSGHVAGAALDVFASEPVVPGSIASHPRVIATPHIAAQTEEAQARAGVAIAEEVLAALQGQPLRWRVA
ncbi:MAG TPA: hydroxyacid dehydrogenase [Anaerolineales bacterium]|nr:hydroxyacid dehydrogenase [Anaerolineales bacterium]